MFSKLNPIFLPGLEFYHNFKKIHEKYELQNSKKNQDNLHQDNLQKPRPKKK